MEGRQTSFNRRVFPTLDKIANFQNISRIQQCQSDRKDHPYGCERNKEVKALPSPLNRKDRQERQHCARRPKDRVESVGRVNSLRLGDQIKSRCHGIPNLPDPRLGLICCVNNRTF